MKKSTTFRPFHLLVLLAGCIGFANAAPYGPEGRKTRWTQPDGKVLQVRVYGDEFYARTETEDGHTLIYKNGTCYYAKLSDDGKSLVSTKVRADEPPPAGLKQHIDIPEAEMKKIARSRISVYDAERIKRWNTKVRAHQRISDLRRNEPQPLSGPEAANGKVNPAVTGTKVGLTILIQFPDDPATSGRDPVDFPTNKAKIERFCNEVGYKEDGNTGSVRDYFSDQSRNALTYTQSVTQVVTVPNPRNFYNYSDYPRNQVLFQDIGATARRLINDAVAVLQSENFNFTKLTVDADGQAIATNVFFAGPDSGQWAMGLWPHQFNLGTPVSVGTPTNPVSLFNYQITNIPDAAPVIGTFCHENGHLLLDYPDLYAFFGEGVGEHCLMGSGNYLNDGKTPSPINGYLKDIVGWSKVTEIAPTEFATATLPTTGNVAYKIVNPLAPTEYFLVENRGDGDKWAKDSNDKGIAIWHIDETTDGNLRGTSGHYGVALMQADGRGDLEFGRNRGDNTDLYDLLTPKFSDSTSPGAQWWDGSDSGAEVEVLSQIGKTTSVSFGGIPPNTIIVSSPNGGEIIYKKSSYPVKWKSNITGNVKIDLFRGGSFLGNIVADTANSGEYNWKIPKNLDPASNYTIRISSLGNPVPTSDVSDANFSVSNATFPENNQIPVGWFKPNFANNSFSVTSTSKFEGKTSLTSDTTGDGKVSGIAYRSNFQAGTVSFYIRVSSEEGFDFAKFYIDGKSQTFPGLGTRKGLSGDVGWTFVQFDVSAGWHTFAWSYEKDSSYAGLKDAAWLDGVKLPTGTQELVLQQPVGNKLVSGISSVSMPDVVKGSSSKPMTFTIKNRGKAKLLGLSPQVIGSDASDFKVRGLGKTELKRGESTTFELIFSPTKRGKRNAILRVNSNDPNYAKFDVGLVGKGLGVPELAVNQPSDKQLQDGDSRNFGIAKVGTKGKSKTFTITNNGSETLKKLKIKKKGPNKKDFKIGALGVKTLSPGDSTTFKVTFKPKGRDVRETLLKILSNDEEPFQIKLSGKGAPRDNGGGGKASIASSSNIVDTVLGTGLAKSSSLLPATTGVEVIGGSKYLSLTVAKPGDGTPAGTVEVSSNLLDWYSGSKHTTVIIDDATTLKVRDNTPVTGDSKRYIRLK